MSWSSKYQGWHARALTHPHPNPRAFAPTLATLQLSARYTTPVNPDGFTLALFQQPASTEAAQEVVCVDSLGRVLILAPDDAEGLLGLGLASTLLPTPPVLGQWRVKHPMTSRPIDALVIRADGALATPSVYGWADGKRALEKDVEGLHELPDALYELVGLLREARATGGEADEEVLRKVKEVLEGV